MVQRLNLSLNCKSKIQVRNNRDVKLKDTVFYTSEAPRRVEVMGRQEKNTNISAHELTTENGAVNNEQDEPTVEEKTN